MFFFARRCVFVAVMPLDVPFELVVVAAFAVFVIVMVVLCRYVSCLRRCWAWYSSNN